MAQTLIVPKQSNPSAATLTALYTVPAGTTAVLSRVKVVNRSSTPTTYRVSIAVAGAADDVSQYVAYDKALAGNTDEDVKGCTGVSLGPGDVVRVYATLATLTFTLGGLEITTTSPVLPAFSAGASTFGNTAGTTGVVNGLLVLVGSNNITLSQSTNGSSATVSFIGGAGGAGYSAGLSNIGNTSGDTGVVTARLVLAGGNNVTLSGSTNAGSMTVTISAGAGGGGSVNFSAGTTSNNLATVVFSNSNGVSFGLNGSTITGSVATSLTNINVSAGTTSNNLSAFVLSNSNNVSFGLNGSTVTATATVASTQGSVNLSAGTTSNLASAFTFSTLNGISFGLDASTITASHNALTSQSNQAASAANGSFAFQTISFSNVNGVSFATAAGSAIQASIATSLTNIRISAGTTSNLLSAVTFSNSNGISFGLDASTITGSHNGITSQTNQQMTLFATGNTTQSSTGTTNASSLIFRAEGVASVGITNGSIVYSVPAGGGGITNINISAGTTSQNLSAFVLSDSNNVSFGLNGSTITATATVATSLTNINISAGTTSNNLSAVTFSNSNGISFGLNGSTVTAGKITHSGYNPFYGEELVTVNNQGNFAIMPLSPPYAFQFDRMGMRMFYSNASNSTGSVTVSLWAVVYTKNASTLSSSISSSTSIGITFSGTVGNHSLQAGQRLLTLGWTNTLSESDYWMGIVYRTTSGGANASFSQLVASQINSIFSGVFGVASGTSQQREPGFGQYSATTSGIPGSVAFSQIIGTAAVFHRIPGYLFISGTV